jgi:hypothetical protein
MIDPISLAIVKIIAFLAHGGAAHTATTTALGHVAATHTATTTALGHVAATHTATTTALGHGAMSILALPVAATTIGGVTFLNVYHEMTNDAYSAVKEGFKRLLLSPQEKRQVLDSAYSETQRRLRAKGIFITEATMREANKLYCQEQLHLAT